MDGWMTGDDSDDRNDEKEEEEDYCGWIARREKDARRAPKLGDG
jgi:hypothetical protein